jgi:hypothetical protein
MKSDSCRGLQKTAQSYSCVTDNALHPQLCTRVKSRNESCERFMYRWPVCEQPISLYRFYRELFTSQISVLPYFEGPIVARNWQFVLDQTTSSAVRRKRCPNGRSGRKNLIFTSLHRRYEYTMVSSLCWGSGSLKELWQFEVWSFQPLIKIRFRVVGKSAVLRNWVSYLWMRYCTYSSLVTADFF